MEYLEQFLYSASGVITLLVISICISLLLILLFGFLWNYYIIRELKELKGRNEAIVEELRELNVHMRNIERKIPQEQQHSDK